MKHFLFSSLIGILLFGAASQLRAQSPPCPADDGLGFWTYQPSQAWTLPNGCHVLITYCWRDIYNVASGDSIERQFHIISVQIESGCSGMSWETIVHGAANLLPTADISIVECNSGIQGKLITLIASTCYQMSTVYMPPDDHPEQVLTACGTGTCQKSCKYCQELVNGVYVPVTSDCVYTENYPNDCTDIPSDETSATPNLCYHIQCTSGW